jgi:hypothetical protein
VKNDPHVESLTYRLETDDTLEFEDPPPLEIERDDLRLRLAGDLLMVWPKEHYASEKEARQAFEPYLRAWESFEAIRRSGRREMRFVFKYARVVDRDPAPFGTPLVAIEDSATVTATGTVKRVSRHRRYPDPPEGFVASPEVEFMLGRYDQYLRGREPLLAMAYFCVTRFEYGTRHSQAGGSWTQKAAREYGVSERVLRTLHRLSTGLVAEAGARKLGKQSENRPPTDEEQRWIERCVLALIRRAGERAADPRSTLPQITMADLPPLESRR